MKMIKLHKSELVRVLSKKHEELGLTSSNAIVQGLADAIIIHIREKELKALEKEAK